ERRRPAVGLVDPADPLVLVVPAWERLQALGDLCLVVRLFFLRHGIPPRRSTSPRRRPRESSAPSGTTRRARRERRLRRRRLPAFPSARAASTRRLPDDGR